MVITVESVLDQAVKAWEQRIDAAIKTQFKDNHNSVIIETTTNDHPGPAVQARLMQMYNAAGWRVLFKEPKTGSGTVGLWPEMSTYTIRNIEERTRDAEPIKKTGPRWLPVDDLPPIRDPRDWTIRD